MIIEIPSEYYNSVLADRKPYESRAEQIANISLPATIRADGSTGSNELISSASQSFNGGLVNNLKSKMGMALLPPSTSSFRLLPDPMLFKDIKDSEGAKEKIRAELSMNTDIINKDIEIQQIRDSLFTMIQQLIIVGSVVVEKIPNDGILVYPLKSFVTRLDSRGNPVAIVTHEKIIQLPKDITVKEIKDEYDLFTAYYVDDDGKWIMKQDIDGEIVGKEKSYKDYDALPVRYFGWNWLVGDQYHRPFAEDYYADMNQVDKLGKLNTEGAVISAKSVLMVDQRGGRTRTKDIADAANGDIIDGRADDVTAFQFNKNFDFQVSNEREATIKKELMKSFLDTGSVQRDAERVTAEEIRLMAQQLESSTLAGIYSKLSLQWSKWIVQKVMKEVKIEFEAIEPSILTGLDSLGRSQESQKLDGYMQRMTALELRHYIKDIELANRYADFEGINTVDLLKTTKEVESEMKAAQQQQAEQTLVDESAKSLGQGVGQQQQPAQ